MPSIHRLHQCEGSPPTRNKPSCHASCNCTTPHRTTTTPDQHDQQHRSTPRCCGCCVNVFAPIRRSAVRPSNGSLACWQFVCLFVCSFVRSFVCSFVCSFVPFVRCTRFVVSCTNFICTFLCYTFECRVQLFINYSVSVMFIWLVIVLQKM